MGLELENAKNILYLRLYDMQSNSIAKNHMNILSHWMSKLVMDCRWQRLFSYFSRSLSFFLKSPVLLWYMHSHHLQRFQTLDHPAVPFADTGRLHVEEGIWHAAPKHSHDGLHVQPWWALWHWVPFLTLEYGWRQWHGILGSDRHEGRKYISAEP